MDDTDRFLSLDRWQLGPDGAASEAANAHGQLDDLGLNGPGGEHLMPFMSPPRTLPGSSPGLLPLDGLQPSMPATPDATPQEWQFPSSSWGSLSSGSHIGLPHPNPLPIFNLLPSKVIMPPPPSQGLPAFPLPQPLGHGLPPAQLRAQAGLEAPKLELDERFMKGPNNVLGQLQEPKGCGILTPGHATHGVSQRGLLSDEDDEKNAVYGSALGSPPPRSRKRSAAKAHIAAPPGAGQGGYDALTLGADGIPGSPPGECYPQLPTPARDPQQPAARRPMRQAASENKFCPDPDDSKGKSARCSRAKSSNYRGVTKHRRSGRYEAHLWIRELHRQVYLGGYEHEEHAAEAYDVAALKSKGMNVKTNFDISRYSDLTACMHSISLEELIMAVRRQSQGFSRGSSTYRGVTHHPSGRWEARIGIPGSKHIYLGLHDDEDGAARAYDSALVRLRGTVAATNFSLSDYRTELSDYHRKQQEILERGQDPTVCSGEAFEDWIKNGYKDGADDPCDPLMGQGPSRKQPRRSARHAGRAAAESLEPHIDWSDVKPLGAEASPLLIGCEQPLSQPM